MTTTDDYTTISISIDGALAGSGKLVDGIIEDCGAQFCDDNDDSIAIYGMIEDRIARHCKPYFTVNLDGVDRLIAWTVIVPMFA